MKCTLLTPIPHQDRKKVKNLILLLLWAASAVDGTFRPSLLRSWAPKLSPEERKRPKKEAKESCHFVNRVLPPPHTHTHMWREKPKVFPSIWRARWAAKAKHKPTSNCLPTPQWGWFGWWWNSSFFLFHLSCWYVAHTMWWQVWRMAEGHHVCCGRIVCVCQVIRAGLADWFLCVCVCSFGFY